MRVARFEALQSHDRGIVIRECFLVRQRMAVEPEHEILAHGKPGEDGAVLGDQNALRARGGELRAVDDDGSLVTALESGRNAQEGRLSAAGGTDDRDQLALADREADAVEHRQGALPRDVTLADVLYDDLIGHSAT